MYLLLLLLLLLPLLVLLLPPQIRMVATDWRELGDLTLLRTAKQMHWQWQQCLVEDTSTEVQASTARQKGF
jgi:hypothetical protein